MADQGESQSSGTPPLAGTVAPDAQAERFFHDALGAMRGVDAHAAPAETQSERFFQDALRLARAPHSPEQDAALDAMREAVRRSNAEMHAAGSSAPQSERFFADALRHAQAAPAQMETAAAMRHLVHEAQRDDRLVASIAAHNATHPDGKLPAMTATSDWNGERAMSGTLLKIGPDDYAVHNGRGSYTFVESRQLSGPAQPGTYVDLSRDGATSRTDRAAAVDR